MLGGKVWVEGGRDSLDRTGFLIFGMFQGSPLNPFQHAGASPT